MPLRLRADAELFLVDKSTLDLTTLQAGLFSSQAEGSRCSCMKWPANRRSRGRSSLALGGHVFLVALTYSFTYVLSGRGAFNQIGATPPPFFRQA